MKQHGTPIVYPYRLVCELKIQNQIAIHPVLWYHKVFPRKTIKSSITQEIETFAAHFAAIQQFDSQVKNVKT